ncbi:AmmeMemoRadiSam system protein B [Vibrio wakamikoensis]|uniref:AmmeMemoRadiSam system protein B n=1 Tax=Vibrio wakamikoensis TaxID=2910251 RepID=UPI003D253978
MEVRPTAVAGRFYFADANQLHQHLTQLLSLYNEVAKLDDNHPLSGLIVPHAGFIFSGSTAAAAYSLLKDTKNQFKRVLLVGPNHRVAFHGCALPKHRSFSTPLGNIPLDTRAIEHMVNDPHCHYNDHAHAEEHCLEVQLPFLQHCLSDFELIPLLTGTVDPIDVAHLIEPYWDDTTLLVISSDLSHFHPYEECDDIDTKSCNKIEAGKPLTSKEACGYLGINAANKLIKQQRCQLKRLSRTNSGDSPHGDRNKVVGYVSYAISR